MGGSDGRMYKRNQVRSRKKQHGSTGLKEGGEKKREMDKSFLYKFVSIRAAVFEQSLHAKDWFLLFLFLFCSTSPPPPPPLLSFLAIGSRLAGLLFLLCIQLRQSLLYRSNKKTPPPPKASPVFSYH